MHEHIAHAVYYFSIHVLCATAVAGAAWALTSIRGASPTAKYWIWVVAAFNFVVPVGALIDELWAAHLPWAGPFALVGGPVWNMTQGSTAIVPALIWMTGAGAMFARMMARIRRDREPRPLAAIPSFVAGGFPVAFDKTHPAPAVSGIFSPRILLPAGIDRLLDRRELHAVLLHEVAHARRRDNLIRLFYELSLCALWFHPLVWLAGRKISVYRELSCDESVIRRGHGRALVSALAKLAVPERGRFLQATASSHLGHRLARLAGPAQAAGKGDLLLASLFAAVVAAGIFQTVAHTACCFFAKG